MHFDDSVESIADSDLEDGELHKMLTSPLCAQKALEKPDALVVQERGKCTMNSSQKRKFEGLTHLKVRKVRRNPMHWFHLRRER